MKQVTRATLVVVLGLGLGGCEALAPPAATTAEPNRTMGLRTSPDLIFKQPIADVVPELQGATATGDNGRVGPEFAFWSYRLADGSRALFHACGVMEGVDCEARRILMCPGSVPPESLMSRTLPGDVRRLQCRPVGQAGTGDLRPHCDDFEIENDVMVGLSSCR